MFDKKFPPNFIYQAFFLNFVNLTYIEVFLIFIKFSGNFRQVKKVTNHHSEIFREKKAVKNLSLILARRFLSKGSVFRGSRCFSWYDSCLLRSLRRYFYWTYHGVHLRWNSMKHTGPLEPHQGVPNISTSIRKKIGTLIITHIFKNHLNSMKQIEKYSN